MRNAKGDLEGALEDYNEAIRLDPANRYAFMGRATVRKGKGDLAGAQQDHTEALRLRHKLKS